MTWVAIVALIFVWALIAAANKQHRDETGVNGPTRHGWRRIRRNARKKGISEAEAYNQWLNRKSAKPSSTAYSFEYGRDDRPPRVKAAPTSEELAQAAADEPFRAAAKVRGLVLRRQSNGLYYFMDGAKLVRNGATFDFTREEVEQFLSH